jgi:hypothetical protein
LDGLQLTVQVYCAEVGLSAALVVVVVEVVLTLPSVLESLATWSDGLEVGVPLLESLGGAVGSVESVVTTGGASPLSDVLVSGSPASAIAGRARARAAVQMSVVRVVAGRAMGGHLSPLGGLCVHSTPHFDLVKRNFCKWLAERCLRVRARGY